VGKFCLVDNDRVEESNLSRITGARYSDAQRGRAKVKVAKRIALLANRKAEVECIKDDVAKMRVAKKLTRCDYLFLAADSMRARLVFNAVVHQYLIPGVQLGSKIRAVANGALDEVMTANRSVRPGDGCLWCNHLIDPKLLAEEAKTDDERKAQAYGVEEPNPSVITLNAVAAAHAVNDFLHNYLGLRPDQREVMYEHFHFLRRRRELVKPRVDPDCSECSRAGLRYARGDLAELPCLQADRSHMVPNDRPRPT